MKANLMVFSIFFLLCSCNIKCVDGNESILLGAKVSKDRKKLVFSLQNVSDEKIVLNNTKLHISWSVPDRVNGGFKIAMFGHVLDSYYVLPKSLIEDRYSPDKAIIRVFDMPKKLSEEDIGRMKLNVSTEYYLLNNSGKLRKFEGTVNVSHVK